MAIATYSSLAWELVGQMTSDRFQLKRNTVRWVLDHLEGEGIHLESPLEGHGAIEQATKDIKRLFGRMLNHKRSERAAQREDSGCESYTQALEQHIKDLEAITSPA